MKSHTFQVTARGLTHSLFPPFIGVCLLSGLLHLTSFFGLLPPNAPKQDMDHALLWYQVKASRNVAEVVLVGDSSCLMNVSGRKLGNQLKKSVLNLGTMSLLDLPAFAALASRSISLAPRTLVLLVHPDFLMRPGGDIDLLADFKDLLETDSQTALVRPSRDSFWDLSSVLGVSLYRTHLETYLRPFPLPGDFGSHYGFNQQLIHFLTSDGGAVDPRKYRFSGSHPPVLEISSRLEKTARLARGQFPERTSLFIGITPIPVSEASPDYQTRYLRSLSTLTLWLSPSAFPLQTLPATLPDAAFASRTHLSESERYPYTELLAHALKEAETSVSSPSKSDKTK